MLLVEPLHGITFALFYTAGVVGAKARMPSDRQTLAQGLFSAAFNGRAGVGARAAHHAGCALGACRFSDAGTLLALAAVTTTIACLIALLILLFALLILPVALIAPPRRPLPPPGGPRRPTRPLLSASS